MPNIATSAVTVTQSAAGDAVASSSSRSSLSLSGQPASPSSPPAGGVLPRQQSGLMVEQWLLDYHHGDLGDDPVRLKAALDRLRDLRGALESTNISDVQNVLRTLRLSKPPPYGKPGSRVRELVVDAIMQERRLLEDQLHDAETTELDDADVSAGDQESASAGEQDDDSPAEETDAKGDADGIKNREQRGEVDQVPSSPLPHSPPAGERSPSPASERRRSGRARQSRVASREVANAEYRAVMKLLRLSPGEVSQRRLDQLSTAARQMYDLQRSQQQQAGTHVSFDKSAAARSLRHPSAAPVMSARSSKSRTAASSRVGLSTAPRAPPTMGCTPPPFDSSASDTDSASESSSEGESEQMEGVDSSSIQNLHDVLRRQGVAASLVHDDVLTAARQSLAGCRTFESFWTSHYARLRQDKKTMASYYEGMALSLILDNRHDPTVWQQLAARRWMGLNLVLGDGDQWADARTLLPMAGTAGAPSDLRERMHKQGKKTRELYASRGTAFQRSSTHGGTGNNRKKGEAGDGKDNGAGGAKQPRRGSTSGAGASQPGATGAGSR